MSMQDIDINLRFYSKKCIRTVDFKYLLYFFSQFCLMNLIFVDIFANVHTGACSQCTIL